MHNPSYENEFNLHVNEISFSYERMSTKTRFEKEAKVIRKWPISIYKDFNMVLSGGEIFTFCHDSLGEEGTETTTEPCYDFFMYKLA